MVYIILLHITFEAACREKNFAVSAGCASAGCGSVRDYVDKSQNSIRDASGRGGRGMLGGRARPMCQRK